VRLSMRRTPTQPPRMGARSVTDVEGFDRGTGTGEPTEPVAHLLRLMKGAGDHFNARDYAFFLEKCHHPDVIVHQIGSPTTVGHETNCAGMELVDRRVPRHAGAQRPLRHPVRPGEWTVALGKLSGTFTQLLKLSRCPARPSSGVAGTGRHGPERGSGPIASSMTFTCAWKAPQGADLRKHCSKRVVQPRRGPQYEKLSVLLKLKGERRGGNCVAQSGPCVDRKHGFVENLNRRIRLCCNVFRVWSG
jgi:hypothetical protein